MKHWKQYNEEEQREILDIASAAKGLPRIAIEKDWWVVMVLKALSMTRYSSLMSFKGGTSLSKGWGLIERFSEDIDIALKREDRFALTNTSNSQIAMVRRRAHHYIVKELPLELKDILQQLGIKNFTVEPETTRTNANGEEYEVRADKDPSVVYVNYESVATETSEYLLPRVKIEISCLSMDEPVETRTLRTFISETVDDVEDLTVSFNTVQPTRTFLEKIFLLHEEFQKEKPRTLRMSRHHYDLERMLDTDYGTKAISDINLYSEIVRHRMTFNHMKGVDYSLHTPSRINIMPPEAILTEWEKDYNSLVEHFLYSSAEHLSFDGLMNRIRELQSCIHEMGDIHIV